MPKINNLTIKQSRFIDEYMIDYNATQAATRAGYSPKTAFIIGWELLNKPKISDEIARRVEALTVSCGLTVQTVVNGLLTEAMYKGEGSTQSARVQAWTQLGRHLGMYTDNVNVSGDGLIARMRAATRRVTEDTDQGVGIEVEIGGSGNEEK